MLFEVNIFPHTPLGNFAHNRPTIAFRIFRLRLVSEIPAQGRRQSVQVAWAYGRASTAYATASPAGPGHRKGQAIAVPVGVSLVRRAKASCVGADYLLVPVFEVEPGPSHF